MDQARFAARFQFLAQVADVDLDDLGLADEIVAPHPLEDDSAIQDLIRMLQEEAEQLVLGRGEDHATAAAPAFPHRGVQPQVREAQLPAVAGRLAPQLDPDPREQLFEGERLHDIVVRTVLQTGDPVQHGIPGREDQDWEIGVRGTEPAADLEPVELWQQHVQHDEVRPGLERRRKRLLAVGGGGHDVALQRQTAAQERADLLIVIHHKDLDRHTRVADPLPRCGLAVDRFHRMGPQRTIRRSLDGGLRVESSPFTSAGYFGDGQVDDVPRPLVRVPPHLKVIDHARRTTGR